MVTLPVPNPTRQPPRPPASASAMAAGEFHVLPFTVAIDTREQTPWLFRGLAGGAKEKYAPLLVKRERKTLDAGDYSIVGMERQIAIERKSESDLWSTLGQGRARFQAEHERMANIVQNGGFAAVLIEAEMSKSLDNPPGGTLLNPASVAGTMTSWMMKYRVPWIWCGGREAAEKMCLRILRRAWESG